MWHPNKWWLKTNSVFQGVDLYNSQILKVFPTIFHHFKIWHLTACNSTILINLKEGGGGAGHNIKEKRRQNAEIALGNGYFRPLGHSKLCAGGRSENLWRDKEKNNAFFQEKVLLLALPKSGEARAPWAPLVPPALKLSNRCWIVWICFVVFTKLLA